uniref:SCP domain-containing protein n=1 Tax=Mycena chlorophos TaxID=658473 RepID=A0ABQ0LSX3_MYCCL|nr:predicted protein [Mycena chlorophos]
MLSSVPILAIFTAVCGFVSNVAAVGPRHQLLSRNDVFNTDEQTYLWSHDSVRVFHDAPGMIWNKTLADAASSWANNCQIQHSDGTLLGGTPYGENIVAGSGVFGIADAIAQFTLDEADYDPSSPTYNHFTQVVWKASTQLGCAVTECPNVFGDVPANYYVCLYYPPGNVVGEASSNVFVGGL